MIGCRENKQSENKRRVNSDKSQNSEMKAKKLGMNIVKVF